MINELNLTYDPKEDTYLLLTKQHDKSTKTHDGYIYMSRIEMKNEINEKKIFEEIKRLKIREAYFNSDATKGYKPVDADTLIGLRKHIKQAFPDIVLQIKDIREYTTQPQENKQ